MKKKFSFRSAWLTACATFAFAEYSVMFKDGVYDQPKMVVAMTVFVIVSILIAIGLNNLQKKHESE